MCSSCPQHCRHISSPRPHFWRLVWRWQWLAAAAHALFPPIVDSPHLRHDVGMHHDPSHACQTCVQHRRKRHVSHAGRKLCDMSSGPFKIWLGCLLPHRDHELALLTHPVRECQKRAMHHRMRQDAATARVKLHKPEGSGPVGTTMRAAGQGSLVRWGCGPTLDVTVGNICCHAALQEVGLFDLFTSTFFGTGSLSTTGFEHLCTHGAL